MKKQNNKKKIVYEKIQQKKDLTRKDRTTRKYGIQRDLTTRKN